MTAASPQSASAGMSHQGLVRKNNEDRIHLDDTRGIYMVIDGMGGHAAGEHAAEIARDRIRSRLERPTDTVEQRIREAIALANNAIYEAAESRPEWQGMGCVLTVAVVEHGVATVGHVGDSRLYKLHAGRIVKITQDHSPIGRREDLGEIGEREAMQHPRRNEVFRDVGSQPRTPDDPEFIEIYRVPLEPSSALLLCSDGLSDVVPSAEIQRLVIQNARDPQAAVESLVEAANRNSKDNVSVVLVAGPEFGGPAKTGAPRIPWWRRGAAMAFYGALLGVLAVLGIERYLAPKPAPPRGPQRLAAGPALNIGAALARAQPGDTVEVAPGQYAETVRLKNGVALIAQKARQAVLLGGLVAEDVANGRVWGLKIQGAEGVSVRNSNLEIQHCEITGARIAGVEYLGASAGSLETSYIHHNAGAGIIVRHPAAPVIEGNIIVENGKTPRRLLPGIAILSLAGPVLRANTITGNGAEPIWTAAAPENGAFDGNFFTVRQRIFRVLRPGEMP